MIVVGNTIRQDTHSLNKKLTEFEADLAFQHGHVHARLVRGTKHTDRGFRSIESRLAESSHNQIASITSLDSKLNQMTANIDRLTGVVLQSELPDHYMVDRTIDLEQVTMALILAKSSFDWVAPATGDVAPLYKLEMIPESLAKFVRIDIGETLALHHRMAADSGIRWTKTYRPRESANRIRPHNNNPKTSISRDGKNDLERILKCQAKLRRCERLVYRSRASNTTGTRYLQWRRKEGSQHFKETPVHIVELTFLPHPHIPACGISIISAVAQMDTSTPPIARSIRPFGISLSSSEAVQYACVGDVLALHGMFRAVKPLLTTVTKMETHS